MDSQRLILFFVFSLSVFFLYESWHRDQAKAIEATTAATPSVIPGAPAQKAQPLTPAPSSGLTLPGTTPITAKALNDGKLISIETDLYKAQVSSVGGDLVRLELQRHGGTLDPKKPFVLFERTATHTYIAQSGLGPAEKGLPNHLTQYTAGSYSYRLADGSNEIDVRLESTSGDVKTVKVLRFTRGSYLIQQRYEVSNGGQVPLDVYGYFQLVRDAKPPEGDSSMVPTFTGAAVYTEQEKFQKIAFGDIEKGKFSYLKNSKDGWIGMLQHYFLGAWLPKSGVPREYYTKPLPQGLHAAGVIVPAGTAAPGASVVLDMPLYAGPQEQEKLAALAPGLELAVDYGWLTVIAKPLYWILSWIHGWTGNWGFAIIVLTILIKLAFYPLSQASYVSMARMRVVAPKMQRIKDQYGHDRQRMQQAMMELYKTEKINPLGSCLPVVVQIPVFIALYWVLLGSVEIRHAPFILWIKDLSSQDPYFILPILMGISMIIQTRLNPEPPDPVQAKVMKIMPIAFSIFFFFFPAGLVLYWLVNNILSIAQQWQVNRVLERMSLAAKKT